MDKHPIVNEQGEVTLHLLVEYCPGQGGFVRDVYMVIDTMRDIQWSCTDYSRARYLSQPRGGTPCKTCGRMACSGILPVPRELPKISESVREDALTRYEHYLEGKPGTVPVSQETLEPQLKEVEATLKEERKLVFEFGAKLLQLRDEWAEKVKGIPWPHNGHAQEMLDQLDGRLAEFADITTAPDEGELLQETAELMEKLTAEHIAERDDRLALRLAMERYEAEQRILELRVLYERLNRRPHPGRMGQEPDEPGEVPNWLRKVVTEADEGNPWPLPRWRGDKL